MLLNVKEMDMQLEEEMCISGCSRGRGCTTIWCYSNCGELKYNIRIYKKDEEMFNVYSSE